VMGLRRRSPIAVSVINFSGRNLKWDYGFFPEKLIIARPGRHKADNTAPSALGGSTPGHAV
jgi:hypothetical protein